MKRQEADEMAELQALAGAATPAEPKGAHLDPVTLARLRAANDDDATLDDAYRHLASCSACRARLADEAAARPLVEAARRGDAPRRTSVLVWAAAAAALLAIGASALLWRSGDDRVAIAQRTFVGTMGPDAGALDAAPNDRDVEITVKTDRYDRGVLLVVDATGRPLAPPRRFEQKEKGLLRVVVAPRTFAAHEGPAHAFVVLGDEAAVARAIEQSRAQVRREALEATGAHVDQLTIASD